MFELTVTEDQHRRLEAVCDDLEDAFVGAYGSVTPADALEYLLDTYTPPGDADPEVTGAGRTAGPALAEGSRSGGPGSTPVAVGTTDGTVRNAGGSTDDTSAGGDASAGDTSTGGSPSSDGVSDGTADDHDLTAVPGVGEVTAEALADAGFDSVSDIRAADPAALTEADGVGEKQAIDISAAAEELAGATGDAGEAADAGTGDGTTAGPDGDAAPGSVSAEQTLQQAQSLLDAHGDRWREGSGDEPYEVDLPDGSTTGARTKDDVKRLLFKHWR